MQIKNVHLVNYRGMKDLTVDFWPGVNLIIGDNGAGKSSLLSGLNKALSRVFQNIESLSSEVITKEEVRFTSSLVGDATESIEYYTPSIAECDIEFDNNITHCKSIIENVDGDTDLVARFNNSATGSSSCILQERINDKNAALPLLAYQSDKKGKVPVVMERVPAGKVERRQGYRGALSGVFDSKNVQNWCFQMELNAFQRKTKITEYETFKKIVSDFVENVEEKNARKNVYFSSEQWTLVYSDGRTTQPLYSLSAGYQGILCLIMDLACRTVILNPRMEDYKAVEGIVLIDEIDQHLHPRWQWKILGALRATFPNVQFIIATHSPIVISSAEDAKIVLMESPNKVTYLPDAYGYTIDDVLELTQGSVSMPQEVRDWRRKIEQALDENDLPKAEGIIWAAEKKLGRDSTTVERMKDFLEVNKWIVEE